MIVKVKRKHHLDKSGHRGYSKSILKVRDLTKSMIVVNINRTLPSSVDNTKMHSLIFASFFNHFCLYILFAYRKYEFAFGVSIANVPFSLVPNVG